MQPSQIQASLDAFLSGDDRVMVIRGAWGVGKTYFWSNYVSRRIEAQSLSQVAYSYVSLFGKSSLPDIRASIFQTGKPIAKDEAIKEQFEKEYQESTELLKNVPWLQSAQEKITTKARLTGWLTDLARSTPFTEKYSRLIASLEYKLVNRYLVCIDDLERKGAGLSIREVMGLIDELANQKKCKVVLIFNDRSLTEKRDKKEFEEYREKVVDAEVEYDPTHSQALAAAFSEDQAHFERLKELTQSLNIKNIRVLRKLKRVVDTFTPALQGVDPLISSEFLNHAAVLVWAHYMRTEALPYDFILSRMGESSWAGYFRKDEEISEDEKRYRALSRTITLSPSVYTDFISSYLAKGYVDLAEVDAATKQLALKVSQQNAHAELNAIWRMFTDSFSDNEVEIRTRFLKTLEEHADKINLSEFSSALEMLHTLGVDVENLVSRYVSMHTEALSAMDPEDTIVARRVSFTPLKTQIAELSAKRSNLTIDEVTKRISVNQGWNQGDIEYLASLTESQLRDWMLSAPEDLPAKVRGGLLFFGRLSGSSEEDNRRYKEIYDKAVAALRSIASTSELNRRRVSTMYGIPEDV